MGDVETWEKNTMYSYPYELVYTIMHHYQPSLLQKMVFEHIQRNMKMMARFIPNFATVFIGLMAKETNLKDKLAYYHKKSLDNLVRVYDFAHINAICLELKLTVCSAYLIEKFRRSSDELKEASPSVASLMTASWKKSGLIASPSSSTISFTVESQKKRKI